jgi:hypothetical protein
MSEGQGGLENPSHGELTSQRKNQPKQGGDRKESAGNNPLVSLVGQQGRNERSHEQLVQSFRKFVQQQQQLYAEIRSSEEREYWPPEEIIRKNLDWQSAPSNKEKGDFFFQLRSAWDALAYDRYEPGSSAENLAGDTLCMYYQHCLAVREDPVIKLSHPAQIQVLDALTEAVGIPHEPGQSVIKIPEKLRSYNKLV